MPTNIKCPNCSSVFDVEHVLSADAEQKLKLQYEAQLNASLDKINADKRKLEEEQRLFEEKRKKENEIFQMRSSSRDFNRKYKKKRRGSNSSYRNL
jgi:hypothetical protein